VSTVLKRLRPNERRGSKPRCHLLTHGSPDVVAERLTALVDPIARLSPSDRWMPLGFENIAEAILPKAVRLLPEEVRRDLERWWLAVPARAPNWDI
jgi:hypothetical protein